MENLVLVGFGSHRLTNLIEKIGDETSENELLELTLGKHLPPVYREQKSCSEEEVMAFVEYVGWLSNLLNEFNKKDEK